MDSAFSYLEKNTLETEDAYPYTGNKSDTTCKYSASKGTSEVSGYNDVTPKSPS